MRKNAGRDLILSIESWFDRCHFLIAAMSCEWQVSGEENLLSSPRANAHVISVREEMWLRGRDSYFDLEFIIRFFLFVTYTII